MRNGNIGVGCVGVRNDTMFGGIKNYIDTQSLGISYMNLSHNPGYYNCADELEHLTI